MMKQKLLLLTFAVLSAFCLHGRVAEAYPSFIVMGYETCMSCHYNPHGNGPLNDYGRAYGATSVADRLFTSKKVSEEAIGEKSGFFGKKPSNPWLRPQINYRGLSLTTQTTEKKESRYIHMDVSASLVIQKEDSSLFVVGQVGYAPVPKSQENNPDRPEIYRSREHYIGYRVTPEFGLYAGLMDKVFGIRVPDHIAYSRTTPQVTMNDQTHGVVGHLILKDWEFGVHGFVGNLVQEPELRQKGYSVQAEYTLVERSRLGVSYMNSQSEYLWTRSAATHLRTELIGKSALLTEVGRVEKTSFENDFDLASTYVFMQGQWWLRRGLSLLTTFEYLNPDETQPIRNYRLGPAVQFFPTNGVELRADFISNRTYERSTFLNEYFSFMAQLHLWI